MLGASAAARAQPVPALDAWFSRMTTLKDGGPVMDGVEIEYRVDVVYVPPEAELQAMRERVGSKPEHPERLLLGVYEKRLGGGRSAQVNRLWRWGGAWRFSMSDPERERSRVDQVWSARTAWQMDQGTLIILNPATIDRTPYRVDLSASNIAFDMNVLLTGGIGLAVQNGVPLRAVRTSDGGWSASGALETPEGRVLRCIASGRWSDEHGYGTVEHVRWSIARPDQVLDGFQFECGEPEYMPPLGMAVARRVVVKTLAGPVDRTLTLLAWRAFDADQFTALTSVPRPDGTDPAWGPVTFRAVVDLSGDPATGAALADSHNGFLPTPPQASAPRRSEPVLRILGWGVAASLLALIVLLRMRARAGGAARSR